MAIAAFPLPETRMRHTMIAAKYLSFADEYQRDIDERWVQKIAEDFDEYRVQMIAVSKREDGSYVIIDGQHRIKALQMLDPELRVLCQVYTGLTIEEEARLYVQLNRNRKSLRATELFKGRIAANDPDALHIRDIVEESGFKLSKSNSGSTGTISAVQTLEVLYRMDKRDPAKRGTILRKTLSAFADAWGTSVTPTNRSMMAVGSFVAQYNPDYRHDRLVEVLESMPQRRLEISVAAFRKEMEDAGVSGAISNGGRLLLRFYNKGLRTRKLPEWIVGKSHQRPEGGSGGRYTA